MLTANVQPYRLIAILRTAIGVKALFKYLSQDVPQGFGSAGRSSGSISAGLDTDKKVMHQTTPTDT